MKRGRAPKATPQRICAYCDAGISESRPVFLVATGEGKILGPYHAGCAMRLSLHHNEQRLPAADMPGEVYGQLPMPAEEKLPC